MAPPASEATIATLITTARKAAEKNRPRIIRSRRCRARAPWRSVSVSLGVGAAVCVI